MSLTDTTPDVIAAYFQAADARDLDALMACFTEDAAVTDEGRTWRGHAEIRRWRVDVATVYQYTVEVLGVEARATDHYAVTTRLEGNFPGGRVDLVYRFALHDGLINALDIAP
jgi:ketosteroid isomerase-like protein